MFQDKKVFITGATGFIGGRIAERLWIDYKIRSKCLIHNFNNAARLSRLPVLMCNGDVLNKKGLDELIQKDDIVFHCAYGNTSDRDLNKRINEEGTENICDISFRKGVRRLIFLSSVAVYGNNPPHIVTEETPVKFSNDEYGNSKIIAERICMDYYKKGLPITIIRPTIVFGPFSPIWTIGVIKRIRLGGWDRVKGLDGLCNPVYIDDLVEVLFLCIEKDQSAGEIFIISGDCAIPWNEYYEAYYKMIGILPPSIISPKIRKVKSLLNKIIQFHINFLRKYFEKQMIDIYLFLEERYPQFINKFNRLFRGGIKDNEIDFFSQKVIYSCNKAKEMMGYQPRPFEEGIRITEKWLRHHEYI